MVIYIFFLYLLSIYFDRKFNKSVENEIQEFSDIAAKLKILYNTVGNFHPQYEGFSFNGKLVDYTSYFLNRVLRFWLSFM